MDIRQLHTEEFDVSNDLSEYAFQYTLSAERRASAKAKFKAERVWGAFNEGRLEAKLTLLPLQVYIQGRSVLMGGIAGVATWPENRRQGLVAKLLTHALQTMNESGQMLSCLHPFLIPFYRKFGYEIYCDYKEYTIPVEKFPQRTEIEGSIKRGTVDIEILDRLYSQFAGQYNGTLIRDKDWWENSVLGNNGQQAVFYSKAGEPEGYVLYKVDNKELVIDEFIYINEQARSGLWMFLVNHDSMVTGATLKLVPSNDLLPFLLPDPRIQQESHPYFMGRIVNAKAFIESFSFRGQSDLKTQILYIEDQYAPWNEGLWEWSVSETGSAALEKIDGDSVETGLKCDIGTLTVMLLGYKRPEELARCERLTGTKTAVNWLENIIPQAQTALLDHF